MMLDLKISKETADQLFNILLVFRDYLNDDILKQTNTLYMTSDFLTLDTAIGLLGTAYPDDELHPKLLITKTETRKRIQDAYMSARIMYNAVNNEVVKAKNKQIYEESGLKIMASLVFMLNLVCVPTPEAVQQAIDTVLSVCDTITESVQTMQENYTDENDDARYADILALIKDMQPGMTADMLKEE